MTTTTTARRQAGDEPGGPTMRVVVIGASFAGLFAAAAAVKAGAEVTLVERDELGDTAEPRRGVPQGQQPHILLNRGLLAMRELLPGFEDDLVAAGALRLQTGTMPWLGPYGWMPPTDSYDIYSLSRPLLERTVRRRVTALPRVTLRDGVRVEGLARAGILWSVRLDGGDELTAEVVIDASGRGSRLPHWLPKLGVPEPGTERVDAHLGYATRRYRNPGRADLPCGVVIQPTPDTPRGVTALPIEGDQWLVSVNGYGGDRPERDEVAFAPFLDSLVDPAGRELIDGLEPAGDVAIHRQTGNQRRAYGRAALWPAGLLAVGDSLCAFNPVYGQGITVAACQAELLVAALRHLDTAAGTRTWQRRLAAVTDVPWSVATGVDLRFPSSAGTQTRSQQAIGRWTDRMTRLAAGGDKACARAFVDVYHLMGSPAKVFAPGVVVAVLGSMVRGFPPAAPRPAALAPLASPADRLS